MKAMVLSGMALLAVAMLGCNSTGNSFSTSPTAEQTVTPTTSAAQLSWTASALATGYYVEQSSDGVNFTQVQAVTSGTTATIGGLTAGQTYYFRVRAYNTAGDSPYSSTVSAGF